MSQCKLTQCGIGGQINNNDGIELWLISVNEVGSSEIGNIDFFHSVGQLSTGTIRALITVVR